MTTTKEADSGTAMAVPAVGQKRLVVVGATGMVGGYALRFALDNFAVDWAQESRHHAPQAERGSPSKLWRLFLARRCPLRSGRCGLLPRNLCRVSFG